MICNIWREGDKRRSALDLGEGGLVMVQWFHFGVWFR